MLARRLLPFVPALALLALAVFVSVTTEVSMAQLMRDTASFAGVPPYTGALSMVGVLLWSAAATVCFFSASLLRGREGSRRVVRFLAASGALTTVLMLDDAFQLHENAGRIGLSPHLVFLGYGMAAAALFWTYRDLARTSEPVLLTLTGVLFALAVGSDVLHDLGWLNSFGADSMAIAILLEDGLKLLGIVSWLNAYVWISLGYLRAAAE